MGGERTAFLASRLIAACAAAGVTIGAAESCTGGLIAAAITSVPGSSACFYGGVVSYDNSVKRNALGVPAGILESAGAVSGECAMAMAEGARRLLGVDIAVSVTGVAGPGGGVPGKPVGTVWFGLCAARGARSHVRRFDGAREEVRARAVEHALELLLGAVPEAR